MNEAYGHNWLLIRGLGRESGNWGEFKNLLHNAFPFAQIHTLDLPGMGRSIYRKSPISINFIVEQLRSEALDKGLLHTPFTILGLSLGGMVAWHWAHRYPQDICAGIMINTSFAGLCPFYRRLRWQSLYKMLHIIMSRSIDQQELAIVRLVSNMDDRQRQKVAASWALLRKQSTIDRMNIFRQLLAAASFRSNSSTPSAPFLLVSSVQDRMVDYGCSEAIRNYYQLPIICHPTAGHDLPLDAGPWLIQQSQEWFQSLCGL